MLRLQQVRETVGISRAEGSRRARINPSLWSQAEQGRFIPYPGQLARMAEAVEWAGDPEVLLEQVDEG